MFGDEANVILVQQCIIQGSTAHSPGMLYRTPHCGVDISSTSLTIGLAIVLVTRLT